MTQVLNTGQHSMLRRRLADRLQVVTCQHYVLMHIAVTCDGFINQRCYTLSTAPYPATPCLVRYRMTHQICTEDTQSHVPLDAQHTTRFVAGKGVIIFFFLSVYLPRDPRTLSSGRWSERRSLETDRCPKSCFLGKVLTMNNTGESRCMLMAWYKEKCKNIVLKRSLYRR